MMNELEFEEAVTLLRSQDPMTYEEGYSWLLGNVDAHFDKLVSLMKEEYDPAMRGKFIEVLGDSTKKEVISVFEAELSSGFREVRFWAYSQLLLSEHPEANNIAVQYQMRNPSDV